MIRSILGLFALFTFAGCTTYTPAERPATYYEYAAKDGAEPSLFSSDAAVLTDADITRILAVRYSPPQMSRLAILPFGWSAWSGWSEEMAVATEDINTRVISVLKSSPRLYDASFLPSILVPEKRNVGQLREAAARFQADLLLVFRSSCRSFEKYHVFGSDRTRAFCAVEAVLLDTRTGLVPFVATASKNYDAVQAEGELNFRETMLRSQLSAIAAALGEVSEAVVKFLEPVKRTASG